MMNSRLPVGNGNVPYGGKPAVTFFQSLQERDVRPMLAHADQSEYYTSAAYLIDRLQSCERTRREAQPRMHHRLSLLKIQ